jgi:hypothetical protein
VAAAQEEEGGSGSSEVRGLVGMARRALGVGAGCSRACTSPRGRVHGRRMFARQPLCP